MQLTLFDENFKDIHEATNKAIALFLKNLEAGAVRVSRVEDFEKLVKIKTLIYSMKKQESESGQGNNLTIRFE